MMARRHINAQQRLGIVNSNVSNTSRRIFILGTIRMIRATRNTRKTTNEERMKGHEQAIITKSVTSQASEKKL